jgi:cell division protein ZapA
MGTEAQKMIEKTTTKALSTKKNFDFKIAGVSYKIKSSHDEETLQKLVQYVDQKVSEAIKVTKNASFQNATVLAALNIAEELVLLKKQAHNELESLEQKTIQLAKQLENSKDELDFS